MNRILKSLLIPAGLSLWRNRSQIQSMLADRKKPSPQSHEQGDHTAATSRFDRTA